MGCVAAQNANSTDLTVQDTTVDEVSSVTEIQEAEINDAFKDLEDSKNNSVKVSTPKNTNPDVKLAAANNEEPLTEAHAFMEIVEAIQLATAGDTIDLEKTTYMSIDTSPAIEIHKSITIDGHGAIVDARNLPLIFRIHEDNVAIINITFINCRSITDGGAIYWAGENGKLVNCTFKDNEADLIDGGALYWSGDNGNIVNCNFINNIAGKNGGAIYLRASNCKIDNCNFTGNTAQEEGGAIYCSELLLSKENNTISNCNFTNNIAGKKGGAIYLRASNCKIDNCNFTGNTAQEEGGAIYCSELLLSKENNTISNCNFTDNSAKYEGGAIYLRASNCKIDNCDFTNNTALADDGGAIYFAKLLLSRENNTISNCNFTDNTAMYNGGAVYLEADSCNITNCFFDANTADEGNGGAVYLDANNCKIDNCGFTENNGGYGGAVYCGDPITLKENNTISNCIFTDNTAEKEGGALYIMGNYTTLDLDYFNNNVAKSGSAIYINRVSEFINISNTEFGRNTADSLATLAVIENNETYALADVTVDVLFVGYDNIANAIWKTGDITSIQFYNITCEFSKDGKGRSLKKFNMEGFANPTEGFEDESKIWQSTLENAQLVDILVTDDNGNVVLNITNGIDTTSGESENSASQLDNTNLIVTDTYGTISVTLPNLKAGKYTVLAKHKDDQYYTADENSDTFVVYELNVTKTSEKLEYDVNEMVKYTITVNNTGNSDISDVTIVENFPEEFYSDIYSLDESLGNNSLWQHDDNTFVYQQVLHPHEVVTLVLELFTYQNGTNIRNSITVSSNITDECIVESNNITVYRPSIDISKTAVNSTVYIGDQAAFIINVTNNGDRPLTSKDTLISEQFNNELIYDHITGITGEWYVEDAEEGIFIILNSALDIGESASFEIYFNTTELGEYENNVSSWWLGPKTVGDTVTVIKIPTETVVENVTAYPDSTIDITVNVTAANGKPVNSEVIVTLPDGENVNVPIKDGLGSTPWHVPEDYAPGNYSVSAFFEDDWYEASNGNGIVTVVPKVNLTVVKTANVTTVANNTLVNFTITITNHGPSNATNVEVSDFLPKGLTYVEAGAVNADGKYTVFESVNMLIPIGNEQFVTFYEDSDIVEWHITKIAKGISVVLVITARTNGLAMGNLTNKVTVNYSENETDSVVNSTNITVVPVVLTIEKTANATNVGNNTFVEFAIIVNNTGIVSASDVYVRDALPSGFVFVDATEGYDEDLKSWIIDSIPAGSSITLNIAGKACEIGNWTNYAMVTSNENNTLIIDSFKVEVALDNLTVVKSANATDVSVGDLVEFTINVTNIGSINTTDINVTDLLDSAFEVQTIGNRSYLTLNDTEKIVWNIPSLNVGESLTLSVVVKLLSEGIFNNTAVVKTPNSDETKSTVNVTALKIPTYISVENVTAYPGMNITVQINVTTDENKAFSGNVTIEFPDGSIQTVEIIEGNGNAKWFVLESHVPGKYSDSVSYSGDDTYLASAGNGTITIESIPTTVIIDNVTVKAGQNVTIAVNVTADNNKPFNGEVIVTLPDGSAETVDVIDGSGEVVWSVPEDYGGNYSVSADYSGNVSYLPSAAIGIVSVIPKISIEIAVSNETAYPDSDVTVTITVSAEDGNPFNGEIRVIMPDGSTQTVEIVDGVASASLQLSRFDLLGASASTIGTGTANWHVPASYAPGNYAVLVEFDGNDDFFAANGTGNIEVIPIPINIKVSNVTVKPGHNVAIPINVISDDNKPFNGIVSVTLPDGSQQSIEIVDGSGEVIWSIPKDYNGVYKYSVNYPGNATFLPFTATGFITVTPDKKPVDNETINPDKKPVNNGTVTPHKDAKSQNKGLAKYETGNPIFALLAVLALLSVRIKRKK